MLVNVTKDWKPLVLMTVVLITGFALRIYAATFGFNYDMESYFLIAGITDIGQNVYAQTDRYNYGPVWFQIINFFNHPPLFGLNPLIAMRYKIVVFLSLVDVAIALVLWKKFNKKVALFFFLNPISIIITGYHSQFDNLAILLGLLAVLLYQADYKKPMLSKSAGLCLLGLSLMTKHVLFMFPIWMVLKEGKKSSFNKLLILFIPFGIFLAGFAPYWSGSKGGIIKNVFLYGSKNNSPFWLELAPHLLSEIFPLVVLFMGTLFVTGMLLRKKSIVESFFYYLIVVVVFSSSLANQYLSICVAALAVYPNGFFAGYSIFGAIFLIAHRSGLHQMTLQKALLPIMKLGYPLLVLFLLLGLVWHFHKEKLLDLLDRTWRWLRDEYRFQFYENNLEKTEELKVANKTRPAQKT